MLKDLNSFETWIFRRKTNDSLAKIERKISESAALEYISKKVESKFMNVDQNIWFRRSCWHFMLISQISLVSTYLYSKLSWEYHLNSLCDLVSKFST